MVEYFIIPDFSELDARGREITNLDNILAKGLGKHHLNKLGLDKLTTSDGKRMSATILVNAERGGVRRVTIEAAPKSSMTNLYEVLSEIVGRSDVDNFRQDSTGAYFTKIAGSRRIEFTILHTAEQPPEPKEEKRAKAAEASEAELPPARAKTAADITDYFVLGERNDFRKGSELERKAVSEIPDGLADMLHAAINRVEVEGGKVPLVLYTTGNGLLQKIDIMPPAGVAVTRVELSSEAMPADQRPGMVRCSYGPASITVHRRHLDEKFDIRGCLRIEGSQRTISPPRRETYDTVMHFLCGLPIRIHADDDTEINAAYDLEYFPRRIFLSPKEGAAISITGYEEARERHLIRETSGSRKRIRDFELPGEKEGTTRGLVVFTQTGSGYTNNWENMGSTGKRDFFDEFYELSNELTMIRK